MHSTCAGPPDPPFDQPGEVHIITSFKERPRLLDAVLEREAECGVVAAAAAAAAGHALGRHRLHRAGQALSARRIEPERGEGGIVS